MTDEGEPLNEVADSEYQETEVLSETNADAQMHAEETVKLIGKLQLVERSIVSPKKVEIIEKMEEILKKERIRLPPLIGIERRKTEKCCTSRECCVRQDCNNRYHFNKRPYLCWFCDRE